MKKKSNRKIKIEDVVQKKGEMEYIKWEDVEKLLGKRRYKEFQKFMVGQTCFEDGIYLVDFYNFLRPEEERFFD